MRHGTQLAKTVPVQDEEQTVRLVKQYDRPEFNNKSTPDDATAALKMEIQMLRLDVATLKDQRRRLYEEVEHTIKMLTAALYENKQETIDQVKRRISKLKGSLEYRGRSDFTTTER